MDIELLKKERRKLTNEERKLECTRERLVPGAEEDLLARIVGGDNTGGN
jgi:hypothetical protein